MNVLFYPRDTICIFKVKAFSIKSAALLNYND